MSSTINLQRQLLCRACRRTSNSSTILTRRSLQSSRDGQAPHLQKATPQSPSTRTFVVQHYHRHHRQIPLNQAQTYHRPTSLQLQAQSRRANSTSRSAPDAPAPSRASSAALRSKGRDRGPQSTEETQTDFAALNVLGGTAPPSTSIDVCDFDGFALDSGLQVSDGDGVVLVSGEAFVWRPWMVTADKEKGEVVNGAMMRAGSTEAERTGGVLNATGQFEVRDEAWGVLNVLWPKPDLLIIGTGRTIRPLAPATRKYLQSLGVRIEILDTRNAASQFNMLATERGVGEVAAAMVPLGFGIK